MELDVDFQTINLEWLFFVLISVFALEQVKKCSRKNRLINEGVQLKSTQGVLEMSNFKQGIGYILRKRTEKGFLLWL
jgi:hypothetical protein